MIEITKQSLLLQLGIAMTAITLLAFSSMLSSVFIAETLEGHATAINQAGALRMHSYRIASQLNLYIGQERTLTVALQVEQRMSEFSRRLFAPHLEWLLQRHSKLSVGHLYRQIIHHWQQQLEPMLKQALQPASAPMDASDYLAQIDEYVTLINTMVAELEHNSETQIRKLRLIQIISLFLTVVVVIVSMVLLYRRVIIPLQQLLEAAKASRQGHFDWQIDHRGDDELGQLSSAFNLMAQDLARMYDELEIRVQQQTANLERSNRSLELLYNTTRRLNQLPLTAESYQSLLYDIERLSGIGPGTLCLGDSKQQSQQQPALRLASTRPALSGSKEPCPLPDCGHCFLTSATDSATLSIPICDNGQQYGILRLDIPHKEPLHDWQRKLLDTVASHIAMALQRQQQAAQGHILALMEERSTIARELHDSLAQSLSYLKIQVALLKRVFAQSEQNDKAQPIIAELSDGLTSAYRQLRELLTTFRLQLGDGDLKQILQTTLAEFSRHSDTAMSLNYQLGGCPLKPNSEVHLVQIIREALSNIVHHAHATQACVTLNCDTDGIVTATIEDDGIGIPPQSEPQRHHYGMTIMEERAKQLQGVLQLQPSTMGGTCVKLRFKAAL